MTDGEIRFDGRVAIVTGAGRGLGRSYALLLAERGAQVVVNDLGSAKNGQGASPSPAETVAAEIVAAGGSATPSYADVSQWDPAGELVDQALATYGGLDIVVANAGIHDPRPFAETSADHLETMLRVHVHGTFNVVRHAWPHLVAQRRGRIVLVASTAGYLGEPTSIPYSTAKGAILGMTRALACAGAEHGITVNAVSPGGLTRMLTEGRLSTARERLARIEQSGVADPGRVAPTVAWLAHESCDLNGEVIESIFGRVTRLVIARTEGRRLDAHVPEDVRDNAAEIIDASGTTIPELGAAREGDRLLTEALPD